MRHVMIASFKPLANKDGRKHCKNKCLNKCHQYFYKIIEHDK